MASFIERARSSLFGAPVRPGVPEAEPGSIIDTAKRQCNEAAGRAYNWILQQSPWVAHRIDDVVAIVSEMERRGYNNHFGEFNSTLLRPLTQGLNDVVRVVRATATCTPNQDVRTAFELWNVLCFWLSVLLALINLVLPFGNALVELVGVGMRYLAAYTLSFCVLKQPERRWMVISLVLLGLYVSSCVFGAVAGLVLLVPAATGLANACANSVLLFYAYQIYARVEEASGRAAMDML